MSRRRLWVRVAVLAGLVLLAQQIWRHGRDYVFADQFGVVEPGRIYRGAWQQSWPMRRIIRRYHIKTIVALAHPADHPLSVREKALAGAMHCRWLHIPIVDDRALLDHKTLSDRLEAAADTVADPRNQPVYFHCHHGINRASMVQMAYRMKYCGWNLEQATDEIAHSFGLVSVDHGPDYRRMREFYEQRVLPARQAATTTTANRAPSPSRR